jgi:hypothetical protein
MQGSRKMFGRPSPAMIVAVIALIAALAGTAVAAKSLKLPKNSVGARQLKKKSVTTGKLANNAVNGAKVANGSLTGQDINLGALGKVPSAQQADSAGNATTVNKHAADCPGGTSLIRGLCFDSSPGGTVDTVQAAADVCQSKGGWLPTPLELYSVRNLINLGTGVGNDKTYTDSFYYDATTGANPATIVIDGSGKIEQQSPETDARVLCVYALVR